MSENNTPTTVDDLRMGAALSGTVKAVELYGAFVDVGIGQDALLHISQLGKSNVRNVEDVVKVGDEITVYVIKVDKNAGRVALSLVKPPQLSWESLQSGQSYNGTVTRIEKFGVFVDIGAERPGMVHVSELTDGFVESPSDIVNVGQEVEVRVLKVNRKKRQIDMSMKEPQETIETVFADEEDEDEALTAMAMAFRKAMDKSDPEADEKAPSQGGKSVKRQQEQEDLIARTLRQHSSS